MLIVSLCCSVTLTTAPKVGVCLPCENLRCRPAASPQTQSLAPGRSPAKASSCEGASRGSSVWGEGRQGRGQKFSLLHRCTKMHSLWLVTFRTLSGWDWGCTEELWKVDGLDKNTRNHINPGRDSSLSISPKHP